MLAVTTPPSTTRAWAIGADGEARLAASLADLDGVRVLHDRRVPGTRGNIDHIVIAPAGVFVVDAKAHKGTVRIRDRGGLFRKDLRLYVGTRDCSRLAEGLTWQLDAVVMALEAASMQPAPSVVPVLCFVEADWPLIWPPSEFRGVRLEGPKSLRRLATALTALDSVAVERLTRLLAIAFPAK